MIYGQNWAKTAKTGPKLTKSEKLLETGLYDHCQCILLSQPYFLTTYMRWSVAGHLKQPGKKINKNFKKSAVFFKFSYKITTYYVGMSF